MTSPDDGRVAALRARIVADSPSPGEEPWEWELLDRRARRSLFSGELPAWQSELFIRVAGPGVVDHRLPVTVAAHILESIQGAITAIGGALVKEQGESRPEVGIRRATQFLITPNVAPGSIVFHLEREQDGGAQDVLFPEVGPETLADHAAAALLRVFRLATADQSAEIGDLTESLRPLGARTASNISKLIDELRERDVELNIGQSTRSGARNRARVDERGCAALREAVDRNREQISEETLDGVLNTVSDGSDKVRLTPGQGPQIRLAVNPDVGLGLGAWLGRRVAIRARKTTMWKLASGKETVQYELLDATLGES